MHAARTFPRLARKLPLALCAAGLLLGCAARAGEGDALVARIEGAVRETRELEARYRASAEPAERIATLRELLPRFVWLDEVAGLQEARAQRLLVLARLQRMGQDTPLRFGYLAGENAEVLAELVVRLPAPDELPAAFAPYAPRLRMLRLTNRVAVRAALLGPPQADFQPIDGKAYREALDAELPPELAQHAKLFALPAELAPGASLQALVLLPEDGDPLGRLGFPLKFADGRERVALALFPEAVYRADYVRFQYLSEKQEQVFEQKHALAAHELLQAQAPKPAPEPAAQPPAPDPKLVVVAGNGDEEPAGIGVVERSGGENMIQVRMNAGEHVRKNEVLEVFKRGRRMGSVQMPEEIVGEAERKTEKVIYFARILDGTRAQLYGGILYRSAKK
ncbi:MAG: hypothetical protein L6R28_10560 [Planctomycetes bacterium]|nr:hypothetical protein [Planctomycetota bacterium]